MALDAAHELEGLPPGARAAAIAPATSAIVGERSAQRVDPWFVLAALALSAAVLAACVVLGRSGEPAEAEAAAEPLAFGLADSLGLSAARLVSAAAACVTTLAVAFAGRSLGRSAVAGLLAAALVGLDPAFLAFGRLAVPTALALAGLTLTLAFAVAARAWAPWVATIPFTMAVAIDPRSIAWGPGLAALAMLRGHIYASPRHLGVALLQFIAIPAVGLGLHVVLEQGWRALPACLAPGHLAQLLLLAIVQPGAGIAAVPNPVTWLAGAAAVLFLGIGALALAGSRFRLARANGRVQGRLVAPLPAVFGRGLWLLLFAIAAPFPQAWLPLFALALAIGVQDLGEDAPGFGITLAVVLVLFAGLVLVRAWGALDGTDGGNGVRDALSLVPWGRAAAC